MTHACQINGCSAPGSLTIRPRSGDFTIVIEPKADEELIRLCAQHYCDYRSAGMGPLLAQLNVAESVTP